MNAKRILLIALLGITICFLNCTKTVETLTTINAPEVKTAFVVQIFDAKTQKLIGQDADKEIRVSVLGKDRSSVKDIFGKSVSTLTTHKGVIALSISRVITPTAEVPVDFVLDFECDGYLHGSLPIQIASTGGHSFIARLVDPSNPPEGISVFDGIVGHAASDGTIENQIDASTPPVYQSQAATKVVIPAGTKVFDKSGNPLIGDLSFRMVYYSNQSKEVLDCFPGSFCVKTLQDGIQDNTLFFSGGWADYDLTDLSGKEAKSFSNPITITMDVPSNTFNPETKTLIRSGDYYPVWNYNFSSGEWEFENEGLLQGPGGNGNFFIEYPATHFSKKNADKGLGETIRKRDSIIKSLEKGNEKLVIKSMQKSGSYINSVNKSTTTPDNIRLIYKEQSTGFIYWSSGYLNAQGDEIYIPDAPCELPTIIEVWGGCPYNLLGSAFVNDLCTEDPVEIGLTNPNPPAGNYINVDFTVKVNCDFAHIRPNVSAFYDDGCGWKYIGQVENGSITVPGLEMGKGYSFGVWINDFWFDEFYTITETSFIMSIDLPEEVCESYK